MRKAKIFFNGIEAAVLIEQDGKDKYRFEYSDQYPGSPVSMTMPCEKKEYIFDRFPPFFEGLLPEGFQLEALWRNLKIDRADLFSQLIWLLETIWSAR